MYIENFGVEEWINSHETGCKYDLTNTCVGVMNAGDLINLSENPDCTIRDILSLKLSYGKVFGSERLRQAICGLYKNIDIENIVITHGAICANALVFLSLLEPDDEVITYLPVYQQHYSIPESIGANVKKIYLKEENNWLPDLDELKSVITDKTKLICINNPNNPTGIVMDFDFIQKFANIARKYGAYILSDEVYRGLNHNGNPFSPSIADIYERGISTSSMSKAFSLPGLRLGWVVAPENIVKKINIQRNYHVISVGVINDYLASIALENKDKIIADNINICRKSIEKLDNWVKLNPKFSYTKPNAGTTAFLKYNSEIPSKQLCENFQSSTGIMLLPGAVMEYENYLRIGYAYNIDEVLTALNKLSKFI